MDRTICIAYRLAGMQTLPFSVTDWLDFLVLWPSMVESIICERAFEFAVRVLKLCDRLLERGPVARHLAINS
jgi:hypothetical protein